MNLIMAIGGVVAAIGLWLVLAVADSLIQFDPPYRLCVLLFIALEIAALVTGIIGRRSSCEHGVFCLVTHRFPKVS
jgi:hypothetical protein